MSKEGYLALAICILVALGALALVLYFIQRKIPGVERKRCSGCEDSECPIAKAMGERKP